MPSTSPLFLLTGKLEWTAGPEELDEMGQHQLDSAGYAEEDMELGGSGYD